MATLRLLIVEDDATDAELVIRELRKGGFDPHSVGSIPAKHF